MRLLESYLESYLDRRRVLLACMVVVLAAAIIIEEPRRAPRHWYDPNRRAAYLVGSQRHGEITILRY